mgnify:CR=1 FL=1
MRVKNELVKGKIIETEETYRHTDDNGIEQGYDVVVVEGDEVIIDIGGEQYTPSVIENGIVLEWLPYQDKECCFSCAQTFEKDSMILAAYGLLFCTTDCVHDKFPDADLNDVEIILASDIGV